MSDGKLIYLAYKSEHQQDDAMDFLACKVCRNKTFTHTYIGESRFPLVRCAACGQHLGRVGWADEADLQKPNP